MAVCAEAEPSGAVFLIGMTGPVRRVIFDPEGDPPGIPFFSFVLDDAPASEELDWDKHPPVCAHCAIADYPEAASAIEAALEHGCSVEWDEDAAEWVPYDEFADEDDA